MNNLAARILGIKNIKDFQAENNLDIDGIIGTNTGAKISEKINKIPFTKTIKHFVGDDILSEIGDVDLAMEISPLPFKNIKFLSRIPSRIFLHHTGGSTAQGAIEHWKRQKYKIGTPFIIDRDGTIYQCFNPFVFESVHLRNEGFYYESDIAIELVGWGHLSYNTVNHTYTPYQYTNVSISDAITLETPMYSGSFSVSNFQEYTNRQMIASSVLLNYLRSIMGRVGYKYRHEKNYSDWRYKEKKILPTDRNIFFHSELNTSRFDAAPTPKLMRLLNNL